MKKTAYLILIAAFILSSCSKHPKKWDSALNGTWIEVDPSTNLPVSSSSTPCELVISENYLDDCGSSYPNYFSLTGSENNTLYSHDGQIYESYKNFLKKHYQYDFDYAFEGQFLWLMDDNSSAKAPVVNRTGASKYKRK